MVTEQFFNVRIDEDNVAIAIQEQNSVRRGFRGNSKQLLRVLPLRDVDRDTEQPREFSIRVREASAPARDPSLRALRKQNAVFYFITGVSLNRVFHGCLMPRAIVGMKTCPKAPVADILTGVDLK